MGRAVSQIFMENKITRIVFILLILCSLSVGATTRIESISFTGNFVTEDTLLLREMYIYEGDEVNLNKIEKSVQAIMDLGLFKSVRYYLAEDYTQSDEGMMDLVILVEEKIYFLILPRIKSNEDGTHYGIQLRWDNIFGLNHEMRLLLEDRGSTDGVSEKRQRIKYKHSNVNDSKYELNFKFINENNIDEIDDLTSLDRKDQSFGVGVSKWLNPTGRNRGRFVGIGLDYRNRENEVVLGTLNNNELDALVLEIRYGYKDVHQYAYNRGGKEFGYGLDASHHGLGSESEFYKHRLYYRSYYRFKSRPGDNLNVQTLLGHSTSNVLEDEAFSLGSSQGLRGYDSGDFEGNTMLLLNIEYMTPSSFSPAFRYVYFVDIGNTYDDINEIKEGELKAGTGFGFRWKIPIFVKVDLRMDFGFGVSDEEFVVSFGTRHVF